LNSAIPAMNLFALCNASAVNTCAKVQIDTVPGLTMECCFSVAQLPSGWDGIAQRAYPLFRSDFLEVIEECPPAGMKMAYVWWLKNGQLKGIMPLQRIVFDAGKSFNGNGSALYGNFWTQLKDYFTTRVKKKITLPTLLAGNLLVTGSPPALFEAEIPEEEQWELITSAISNISKSWTPDGEQIVLQLVKDSANKRPKNYTGSYVEVNIQPAMVLTIPEAWRTFDDYLGALNSKYRIRYRRAQKYCGNLQVEPISIEHYENVAGKIYALYEDVIEDAGFNLLTLHADYFKILAQKLGNDFKMFGWYNGNDLIGFHTTLHNGKTLEAHYLGIKKEYNKTHQLYLNMLYAITRQAIEEGYAQINFARTALEIKSSVGAKPQIYHSFLRHRKQLTKGIVQGAIKLLNPPIKWEQRHPFKTD